MELSVIINPDVMSMHYCTLDIYVENGNHYNMKGIHKITLKESVLTVNL
jgi:hypothetical protein